MTATVLTNGKRLDFREDLREMMDGKVTVRSGKIDARAENTDSESVAKGRWRSSTVKVSVGVADGSRRISVLNSRLRGSVSRENDTSE